jgi:hypothetical protein
MSFADNYELGERFLNCTQMSMCFLKCNEVTLADIVEHVSNLFAGEPISSHAKGYEAVVHFGETSCVSCVKRLTGLRFHIYKFNR